MSGSRDADEEVSVRRARARVAKAPAPAYIRPRRLNPAKRLMRWATQPREMLMRICKIVVKIAIEDCVRPIKWRGTIIINVDCATTPETARQNPKMA